MSKDILDLILDHPSVDITFHAGTGWQHAEPRIMKAIRDHFNETGENLLPGYINMVTWHNREYVEYISGKKVSFKERYEAIESIKSIKVLGIINQEYADEALKNITSSEIEFIEPTRRYKAQKYIKRQSIREEVFKRYGHRCLNCGTTENIALDHIKPISEGGLDTIDNLQPLCHSCNSSKGSKTIDYR